jgi:hypothetical protein
MAFQMAQQKRVSFSDVLETESDRLATSVFEENPNISSYEDFETAFFSKFSKNQGVNAQLNSDDAITLFNTQAVKDRMKENTTAKEYDEAYGDGNIVTRVPVSQKRVVTISVPKISVPKYQRSGRPIKSYSRGKSNPFTPAQIMFLKQRTGRPPKQIISEYNSHFNANPRTASSISTKVYRINKSGGGKSGKSYSQK